MGGRTPSSHAGRRRGAGDAELGGVVAVDGRSSRARAMVWCLVAALRGGCRWERGSLERGGAFNHAWGGRQPGRRAGAAGRPDRHRRRHMRRGDRQERPVSATSGPCSSGAKDALERPMLVRRQAARAAGRPRPVLPWSLFCSRRGRHRVDMAEGPPRIVPRIPRTPIRDDDVPGYYGSDRSRRCCATVTS